MNATRAKQRYVAQPMSTYAYTYTDRLQLFSALSETLHNQLKQVTSEKHEMTEEAERLIKAIKQMEASLVDSKPDPNNPKNDGVAITYPLTRCVKELKAKYSQISQLHRERWEEVKSPLFFYKLTVPY
jgi:protein regulator of cytokinesis 1